MPAPLPVGRLACASSLLLALLLLDPPPSSAVPGDSCSVATDWKPWHSVEHPWVLYADQNCPSSETVVDDAAIWQAAPVEGLFFENTTHVQERYSHSTNKSVAGLARPAGIVYVGGSIFWAEQDSGLLRTCPLSAPCCLNTCCGCARLRPSGGRMWMAATTA